MTDPPGVQPALGIEAVEWSPSRDDRLTVRVTGRWIRRPPASRGQPMLVVAADGQRHRFPAMPEPPGLSGTAPGAWSVSFSVPAWLAPFLSRRLSMQIGGVIVPLPGARSVNEGLVEELADTVRVDEPADSAAKGEPGEESEPVPSEADDEAAVTPAGAGEAAARIETPEREIQDARLEPDSPTPATSMAHELDLARDAPAAPAAAPAFEPTEPRGLRRELQMLALRSSRPPALTPPGGSTAEHLTEAARQSGLLQRALDDVRQDLEIRAESEARLSDTVTALRGELQARTNAEAHVRAELATVQGTLEARAANHALLETALADLRAELANLRAANDEEATAHAAQQAEAAERSTVLTRRISELERELVTVLDQLAELSAAHNEAEAEVLVLSNEIATLRGELSAAQESSRRDAAALREAETLLAEAHQLASDAEARVASERTRAQDAVAAREQLEREFAEYRARSARVHGAIEELRRQLALVRASHASPGVAEAPRAAEAARAAEVAPTAARASEPEPPARASEPEPPAHPERPTEPEVQPERLSEALARLRESKPNGQTGDELAVAPDPPAAAEPEPPAAPEAAPAPKPAPAGYAKRWLKPVLRALVADDPTAAGELVLDLLPAQRLVWPRPVFYDLILGERECVRVTVEDTVEIERAPIPRAPTAVGFQITGDRASLAKLVTAGRARRRFSRQTAKVSGSRRQSRALRALGRGELRLAELHAAGVRLEASLLLKVVSLMIDPGSTVGERFTVAYEQSGVPIATIYVHVQDGKPVLVGEEPPAESAATTIACPADSLALLLVGVRAQDVVVRGDERPLALLQQWILRAQSV